MSVFVLQRRVFSAGFGVAFAALAATPAAAQVLDQALDQEASVTIGAPELRGAIEATPALTPEEEAALRTALNIDANSLTVKPRAFATDGGLLRSSWSRSDRRDGSATVTVNRPLPTEWDAKVGADLGLAAANPNVLPPERVLNPNTDNGSGAAWANVAVPNVATFDARVNPMQDQGGLGATLKQSVPLGSNYSVTLQNRFGMVDTLGAQPVPGASTGPGRYYTTDREVKLNVLSSKTAIAAGTSSSTVDNATRGRISAEQQIYGPLKVSTAVSDIGAPVTNKSLTAGFKLDW